MAPNKTSQTSAVVTLWTVYERPRDYPDDYVARAFEITREGVRPTRQMFTANTLAEVRVLLPLGLIPLPRDPYDDPVIVETWV